MSMSSPPTVGIIANPAAGKDIRRLVSSASPTSDMAKIGIIRRAVVGAVERGAERVVLTDDRRSLSQRALERIGVEADFELLAAPPFDVSRNSVVAAMEMRDLGAGAVIVLGGDGTHRDVVKGWRGVPMIGLSTGTNNVFPRQWEPTVAGEAAALVATGTAPLDEVSWTAKVIDVEIRGASPSDDGAQRDLALVDLALIGSTFTASRAVWEGKRLRTLVATVAEPASVGLSTIAARLAPVSRREPGGVCVEFAADGNDSPEPATTIRAPLTPGRYDDVEVSSWTRLSSDDAVELRGPGVLSFDGERDVMLGEGDIAIAAISPDGPRVIDVEAAMAFSARPAAQHVRTQHDRTEEG